MTGFSVQWNVWIDLVAIVLAIIALVLIGWQYKNKKSNSGLGITLIGAVVLLLVLSIFYDIRRGSPPISQLKLSTEGLEVIFNKMETQINLLCNSEQCEECFSDYAFSRDWQGAACEAIKNLKPEIAKLVAIPEKSKSDFYFFKKIEAFRKHKIQKLEAKIESITQSGNIQKTQISDLKIAIAEILIFDRLLITSIEEVICSE